MGGGVPKHSFHDATEGAAASTFGGLPDSSLLGHTFAWAKCVPRQLTRLTTACADAWPCPPGISQLDTCAWRRCVLLRTSAARITGALCLNVAPSVTAATLRIWLDLPEDLDTVAAAQKPQPIHAKPVENRISHGRGSD